MKVSLKRQDRNQGNSRLWRIQKLIRCIFSEPQRFLKRLCIVSGTVLALGAGVALAAPGDPTDDWNLHGQDHFATTVHGIELTDYIGSSLGTVYVDNIVNVSRFSESNASVFIDENHKISGLEADSSLLVKYLDSSGTIENFTDVTVTDELANNTGAVVYGNGAGSTLNVSGALTNGGDISFFSNVTAGSINNNDSEADIIGTGAGSILSAGSITNAGGISDFSHVTSNGDIDNSSADAYIWGADGGSTLLANGNLTNGGEVKYFETVKALGDGAGIENSGTIAGEGAFSELSAEGDLTNTKTVTGFASVAADNISNDAADASITGTGAGSALSAKTDLTNSGTIGDYALVSAGGDLTNDKTITGSGADSNLTAWNNLNNKGNITDFAQVHGGSLTNETDGTITGAGAGADGNELVLEYALDLLGIGKQFVVIADPFFQFRVFLLE
ncbi:MAG: hypothetical protein J6S75_15575, partial [Thermoguttaceae bacterium]|nr:hypothetical protein [Thermoguttaceae bacterium]